MSKAKFNPYPILLNPIYKEKVWGGRKLEFLMNKKLPKGKLIGESWEVSDRPGDICKIRNGLYKGKDLHFLFANYKKELLGDTKYKKFPLLIKFIDSEDDLSVQVHPDDNYALKNEKGDSGKTECWYVIDAKKGARIIYGLKNIKNKKKLRKIIRENRLKRYLNYENVTKGDFIYNPAGTVHAILKGIVIAEIQQSSDLTYRLYDWDRNNEDNSRLLHIEKSIDVINLRRKLPKIINVKSEDYIRLAKCKYFTVDKLILKDKLIFKSNNRFQIYTIISGEGKIRYSKSSISRSVFDSDNLMRKKGDIGEVVIKKGDNVIIPASLKHFEISPIKKLEMLITNIED